jgi:hypothetical protein
MPITSARTLKEIASTGDALGHFPQAFTHLAPSRVFGREGAVFWPLGRKRVKSETDRLGSGPVPAYGRAVHRDPGSDEMGKIGGFGAYQILGINSLIRV